jgi:hypothetical protein
MPCVKGSDSMDEMYKKAREVQTNNLGKLPRFIYSQVKYQLTIRAWADEWTISYEWGGTEILGEIIAHGNTIDDAAKEMLFLFEQNDSLKRFQHLL